jgi:hypothetical protein
MPAFNHATLTNLQANVRSLYYKRLSLARLNLTHEEMIQTFVTAEARQIFRDVMPYQASYPYTHELDWVMPAHEIVKTHLRVYDRGFGAPPVPRNIRVQPDASQEAVEKINFWISNGGDVSRDFGRVMCVLEKLNALCSKQTMRYYWPSIIAICSESDHTKAFAQELQQLKTPTSPKPLPRGLLLACKTTSETIATAKLIPEDMKRPEDGEVTLEVAAGRTFQEPDLGTFHGLT